MRARVSLTHVGTQRIGRARPAERRRRALRALRQRRRRPRRLKGSRGHAPIDGLEQMPGAISEVRRGRLELSGDGHSVSILLWSPHYSVLSRAAARRVPCRQQNRRDDPPAASRRHPGARARPAAADRPARTAGRRRRDGGRPAGRAVMPGMADAADCSGSLPRSLARTAERPEPDRARAVHVHRRRPRRIAEVRPEPARRCRHQRRQHRRAVCRRRAAVAGAPRGARARRCRRVAIRVVHRRGHEHHGISRAGEDPDGTPAARDRDRPDRHRLRRLRRCGRLADPGGDPVADSHRRAAVDGCADVRTRRLRRFHAAGRATGPRLACAAPRNLRRVGGRNRGDAARRAVVGRGDRCAGRACAVRRVRRRPDDAAEPDRRRRRSAGWNRSR